MRVKKGGRCMDQVLAVMQVCEKYLATGKDVFWAISDLEKEYDTINQTGMWQKLRAFGVIGKLLKAVQSFYVDSMPVGCVYEKEWMWMNGFSLILNLDSVV